jgi:hypothetical protein
MILGVSTVNYHSAKPTCMCRRCNVPGEIAEDCRSQLCGYTSATACPAVPKDSLFTTSNQDSGARALNRMEERCGIWRRVAGHPTSCCAWRHGLDVVAGGGASFRKVNYRPLKDDGRTWECIGNACHDMIDARRSKPRDSCTLTCFAPVSRQDSRPVNRTMIQPPSCEAVLESRLAPTVYGCIL